MTELLLCGTEVREAGQGKEDNCEVLALPTLRTFGGGARDDGGPRKPALLLRVDCAGLSRRLCQSAIGGVDTFSPNLDPMVHLGSIPLQTMEFLAVLGGVVEEVSQKGAGLGNLPMCFCSWLRVYSSSANVIKLARFRALGFLSVCWQNPKQTNTRLAEPPETYGRRTIFCK